MHVCVIAAVVIVVFVHDVVVVVVVVFIIFVSVSFPLLDQQMKSTVRMF